MQIRGLATALASLALPAAVWAAGEDVEQGLALAREGRCAEAVEPLQRAWNEGRDPSALRTASRCLLQLKRYDEARRLLEPAPEAGATGIDLLLGIARYHGDAIPEATEALERAVAGGPESAEAHLYLGLARLRSGNTAEATASLETARALDPERAGPMASYYLALARSALGDRQQAEEEAQRARALDPEGPWVSEAENLLAQVDDATARRWQFDALVGLEYDDNVVLRGEGTRLPTELSGQGDVRGTWRMRGVYELLRGEDWSAGATTSYAGSAHPELVEFDVHFPTAAVWFMRRLSQRVAARLEYQLGHAWVAGEPFLLTNVVTPTVVAVSRHGTTRLFGRAYVYSYDFRASDVPDGTGAPGDACPNPGDPFCGPPGVDESQTRDRDGVGWALGFEHAWPFGDSAGELRGGYTFQQYRADGREARYLSHEPRIGARFALPWQVALNTWLLYSFRPYAVASTVASNPAPGVQYAVTSSPRDDHLLRTVLELRRPVGEHLFASLRYSHIESLSNVPAYEYSREIAGAYLTFRFSR